ILSGFAHSPRRGRVALKPFLSAHTARVAGRQAAGGIRREVLRELYPAALRAYPDPAEPIPLAVLDALPEPGRLGTGAVGRATEQQVIGGLVQAGFADQTTLVDAITALRVAIAETPRRAGMNRSITAAVAEAVRHSVAAVRACDAA